MSVAAFLVISSLVVQTCPLSLKLAYCDRGSRQLANFPEGWVFWKIESTQVIAQTYLLETGSSWAIALFSCPPKIFVIKLFGFFSENILANN